MSMSTANVEVVRSESWRATRLESGSALFVVIVLLALLALIGFFATQVSLSEQQTSRADVRARAVAKVAETGVNHAMEYLSARRATILPQVRSSLIDPDDDPDTLNSIPFGNVWEQCAAADTDFPCGAASPAFRAQTYRYIGTAGADDLARRSLPLTTLINDPLGAPPAGQAMANVDGFAVTYRVGAILCPVAADPGTGFAGCVPPEVASTHVVALVSQGRIDNEDAGATVTETVGVYRTANAAPNVPPVTASGIVDGLGNSTVVPNPNSGGPGVPVSVWSRRDFDLGGSEQTCEADEFFRAGVPVYESGVPLCNDCACTTSTKLTQKKNGVEYERYDVLDRDNSDGGDAIAPNPYPFPCDLFEFTLGVAAREDLILEPGDGIALPPPPPLCETQIMTPLDPARDWNGDGTVDTEWPAVVAYLETNALKVGAGGAFASCNDLINNPAAVGLIWAPGGCTFTGNAGDPRVGSPARPIILVSDGEFSIRGPTFFGIVFIRDTNRVLNQVTGGSAQYASGGGTGIIYGGVVIEGPGKLNGGLKVISSPRLLGRLSRDPAFNRFGRVPGTWSDLLSY